MWRRVVEFASRTPAEMENALHSVVSVPGTSLAVALKITVNRYLRDPRQNLREIFFPAGDSIMLAQPRSIYTGTQASQLSLPSSVSTRAPAPRAAIGIGTATIGVAFLFNLDLRVDQEAIDTMIEKACYVAPGSDEIVSTHVFAQTNQRPFIQFRRVPGETFGIALFRAAAPAARAAKALTGVTLFGKELFCQLDKRTYQLVEQWKFLRGKELATKIASQGYEVPSNMMEIVSNELSDQVNKAKGLVVEQAAFHELRLTRFQGLSELEILEKKEEDRIQDVLVQRAEEAGQVDKTNAEVRVLASQLQNYEDNLAQLQQELFSKPIKSSGKRRLEHKSKASPSLFELRQLIPTDRDSLFHYAIDWDSLFNVNRGGGKSSSIMRSLVPWLVRKVKDYMGSYDREFVEYVLRKIRLRVDPLDLVTDMRQYIDDEAEEFVKGIWTILVFETVRRQHGGQFGSEIDKAVELVLAGYPPSGIIAPSSDKMDLETI